MSDSISAIAQSLIPTVPRSNKRLTALFLLAIFTISIFMPFGVTIASALGAPSLPLDNTHSKPDAPANPNPEKKFKYSEGIQPTVATKKAAVDSFDNGSLAALSDAKAPIGDIVNQAKDANTKITPHELVNKRTAMSSVSVNEDGSLTQKNYFSPKFYQKEGKWITVNNKLSEDTNAGNSGNFFGRLFGQTESAFSSTKNYKTEGNDWQAYFSPSGAENGMVRVGKGAEQVGFVPKGANQVDPQIVTSKDGKETVRYVNLWDNIDVEYTVGTAALKENIVIKNKSANNKVAFSVVGASLQKQQNDKQAPYYSIKGALGDEFGVAPANLILNKFGFVSKDSVLSQDYSNGQISLSVDSDYLKTLPESAFPAVIDPGVFRSSFGTRAGGNYISFKTDGYICYSNVCNLYGGSLYDSNNNLQYWRGAFFSPYDQFRNSSNILTNANLHLSQLTNVGFWTGTYDTHNFQAGHATCLNNFNCVDGVWGSSSFATVGDINLTSMYQNRIASGDFGAWAMVMGEDGSNSSFKNFDPDNSYVDFSYGGPPPAPSIATPTAGQVYVDPQPSFKLNASSNPNGATPLQYEMLVSSATGAAGSLISSGLLSATQWTVPDGILQDGSTYYVQARSFDPITGSYSGWGNSTPFRIDMRIGKDKTQTFDSLGPVNIDLATGNATTGNASHTSNALGGSLGVSLDYNSPFKSRNGLVGEYWNVAANYTGGAPTTSPNVTRVDQNIDNDWGTGSPSAGAINNDWFYARWMGFFVAPTTGTYTFGGNNDDLLQLYVNNQMLYSNGFCPTGICYGTSVTLQAGQVVPIRMEYKENTGSAYVHAYVKGPVDEQIIPTTWLQTGARPIANQHGLTGRYYGKFDGTNTFSAANSLIMQRSDPYLNFDWGDGSPMPNGPDGFLVRWTGYITAPTTGLYNFGSRSDDGTKITVGTSNTVVYNDWTPHGATEGYGTGVSLSANQPVPITIEYFDQGGPASFQFKVQGSVPQQIVPSDWLSPKAQVLPDGWNLGIDPDGDLGYDHMKVNQNSAILTDSSGDTHEYAWTGSGYKPPVNEDGLLVRNGDGTYTLQDVDGRTYIFAADGTLSSVTSAVDDRKPAALQYEYQSQADSPPHLYKVKDGVDPSRNATVYYSGDAACGAAPSGFDANAPSGMVCAVKTNDGRATNLYYLQGQLARVAKPGSDFTDYGYESVVNIYGATTGYRMNTVRDSRAMDAIAAGVRTNDSNANTQLFYDDLGRVTDVRQPAATAGANRIQHNIEYLPGAIDKSTFGVTKQHIVGAAEPNGFQRKVTYDNLFRTIEDADIANLVDKTQWDTTKDLIYSATDEKGLKSTTVYDDEDRPISSYGPAPVAWFDSTNAKSQTPLASYASQVPRSDKAYDENIVGPAVAWFDYTKQTGNANGVLSGAPKLHTTGINTATPGVLNYDFVTPPITASTSAQGIGLSATGKLRVPNGTYTVNADTSDGIRIWVDDTLILDNQWIDSASRTVTSNSFTVSDSLPHRFRIDAYRRTGSNGALQIRIQQQGGFAYTNDWSNYLKSDYSLETSGKVYDSQIGNITNLTNYGANAELSLPQSTTTDQGGLNLTTSMGYEQQGANGSFLRQTSKTLPGGNTTSYGYSTATATADNPCTTTTTEAYKQAGMINLKTQPDPDGSGPLTPITQQIIYDDAGRPVATRTNQENEWSCKFYDDRGRISSTYAPAYNGERSRSDSYNWAVNGNPLASSRSDWYGTLSSTVDLLGRKVSYKDVFDNVTNTAYDNLGRVQNEYSQMGTRTYTYNTYNQLTNDQLDNVDYAHPFYDQFGRLDHVDYPGAGSLALTAINRDVLGRTNGYAWRLGDGTTTVTNTVARTQSGQIVGDTTASGASTATWNYTLDKADRLTGATLGANSYSYGFGPQDASCAAATNANSGKNANRTSSTINGVSTNYCYDNADRLSTSSDPTANAAQYDSHGNMTILGSNTNPLRLKYDSVDRAYGIEQYNAAGNGLAIYYDRDIDGRIVGRYPNTITNMSWQGTDPNTYYDFTGDGDSPDFARNSSWQITEKFLTLPGGVMATIRPLQTGASNKVYTLPNVHGDTLLTTDASGANTTQGTGPANSMQYDPFGKLLASNTAPNNTIGTSFSWLGQHQKSEETGFIQPVISMGARIYLVGLGRFAQVDPIEGGVENNYVYPPDPVNGFDLTGQFVGPMIGVGPLGPSSDPCYDGQTCRKSNSSIATKLPHSSVNKAQAIAGGFIMCGPVCAAVPVRAWKGNEIKIGGVRIATIGNPRAKLSDGKPNWPARLPHYHRRVIDKATGRTKPGGSMKRHRPWEGR